MICRAVVARELRHIPVALKTHPTMKMEPRENLSLICLVRNPDRFRTIMLTLSTRAAPVVLKPNSVSCSPKISEKTDRRELLKICGYKELYQEGSGWHIRSILTFERAKPNTTAHP